MIPLLDRPPGATLFHGAGGSVTAARFLHDARTLAASLPGRTAVVNRCQDRYAFAVGLAAALLRGQLSLLAGQAGGAAQALAGGSEPYVLSDEPVPDATLPVHRYALTGQPAGAAPALLDPEALDPEAPAIVVFTSGSTGTPVGTRKSFGELAARSRAAGERFGLTEADPACLIGTVPPQHMYGLETTVLLPWHAACASYCGPAFFPADIAAGLCRLPGRRVLVTTPLHLRAVLRTGGIVPAPDQVISATAPLEASLAREVEAAWGAPVFEIFGASELGSIASRRTAAEESWTLYPGVGLDEAWQVSAPGAPPRPLSDQVERAPGGFTLIGRRGDLIKLGGRRASLLGLTRILSTVDGVNDGVFVAPDDLDRRPTARLAAVAVAPGRTPRQITEALRAQIDPVFLPRPLLLVDSLPRDRLGKVPRASLLALLERRAG